MYLQRVYSTLKIRLLNYYSSVKSSRSQECLVKCLRPVPLLESAVEEIRKKAEKKEIQIKIEMDFEAEAVFDRKWTEEALYNLLDNAVKYSPAGSEVLISTKLYEMWCVIAVSDRGRGISEEEIPKIFGRFYRAKEVQQEEGVGIGLYLVREILQKEGGFIKVNSEVGKGSTFLCYLPR